MTTALSQQTVSRRGFLKAATGFLTHATVGGFNPLRERAAILPQDVAIPPSLMLHSQDAQLAFLPPLLEQLNQAGFTAVTYRSWQQMVRENRVPAKPIILSIDDISMAKGACAAFSTFAQMKEWIRAAGMTAVFGVITEPVINGSPQREQDEARWDIVRGWLDEGFELATHTSYHSNFNAMDSGPRSDFTAVDYEAEIVRSAQLIEAKLAERGLNYPVRSLIMPYGSGYSYKLTPSQIHAGISAACGKTNIEFVIGIAQGRKPLSIYSLLNGHEVVYVGRLPPAYLVAADGKSSPYADLTFAWLLSWHEENDAVAAKQPMLLPQ
ncbi:polysaccharide deacetylase family protein [Candidatus Leptofilum sp.]|uniref:polysaccharide deacetylase family protein n=1 Tax=Candidatus Leptofilum sp. TaxID=3241576 RepID=UPI003B5B415C